ncbi:hypothetical protein VTK73DRAFT_8537 [Phialemonium thermophilum]|uniref:Uncharacterized protein n=1 Tax=Phialemonium thermophilum TaxID=223376 RepID=A0ABR3W7U9_9PEZI
MNLPSNRTWLGVYYFYSPCHTYVDILVSSLLGKAASHCLQESPTNDLISGHGAHMWLGGSAAGFTRQDKTGILEIVLRQNSDLSLRNVFVEERS